MIVGATSPAEIAGYIIFPAAALIVAWLAYRRGRRSSTLTDSLATVQLWREQNAALEKRLNDLEAQNKVQAAQMETLKADNARLTELVTNAAKVDALAKMIVNQHEELMETLGRVVR